MTAGSLSVPPAGARRRPRIAQPGLGADRAFGTLAALALQRVGPRLRVLYDTLTYVAIVIPGIVIGISSLVFFVNVFGFLNPLLASAWPAVLGPAPQLTTGLQTIVG